MSILAAAVLRRVLDEVESLLDNSSSDSNVAPN